MVVTLPPSLPAPACSRSPELQRWRHRAVGRAGGWPLGPPPRAGACGGWSKGPSSEPARSSRVASPGIRAPGGWSAEPPRCPARSSSCTSTSSPRATSPAASGAPPRCPAVACRIAAACCSASLPLRCPNAGATLLCPHAGASSPLPFRWCFSLPCVHVCM